jgi:hypothetical protein
LTALNQAVFNAGQLSANEAFDNLDNRQLRPENQTRTTALAGVNGTAKRLFDRLPPSGKAIYDPQNRPTRHGCSVRLGNNLGNQRCASFYTDGAPDKQPRENSHAGSQPHSAALTFDVQLISLNPSQVHLSAAYSLLLYRLGMLPGFLLPGRYSAFIQSKGQHNGLNWTTISQQAQDDDGQPTGIFQTIQRRSCRFGECLVALVAFISSLGYPLPLVEQLARHFSE